MADLNQIFTLDESVQVDGIVSLVKTLTSEENIDRLKSIIVEALEPHVPTNVAKSLLENISTELSELSDDQCRDLGEFIIDKLQSKVTFQNADRIARNQLCEVYRDVDGDYEQAAKILIGIGMNNGVSESEKFELFTRIASLFLEEDLTLEAEVYITKAQPLRSQCTDKVLLLRFHVAYARILDSNRKFIEASKLYYELSQQSDLQIDHDEVTLLLSKAITCAILGPAGIKRSRMLGKLFKDSRTKRTSNSVILEKVYMERLLNREEVTAFELTLLPHQKAKLSDNSSVLDRAIIEHNILALTKIYRNISFMEMATMLEIDANKAESTAATMITEERMHGSIDQVSGYLEFKSKDGEDKLVSWDKSIQNICLSLNEVVEVITNKYPETAEAIIASS